MCDGRKHNLKVIVEYDIASCESKVVRWCADCGAIVIDRDYDGRTNPGAIMSMQFPSYRK